MNQELWPCGPSSHTTILVLFPAPQIEMFYYACMQPFIEESVQNRAVCCCKTIEIPPTLQAPAAEVISQEAIVSHEKDNV